MRADRISGYKVMRGFSANRPSEADPNSFSRCTANDPISIETGRLIQGGFAARLSEIAEAHPDAERFEIWSQDEARVGQKGRTGYV
jgi:hypothetical protein